MHLLNLDAQDANRGSVLTNNSDERNAALSDRKKTMDARQNVHYDVFDEVLNLDASVEPRCIC